MSVANIPFIQEEALLYIKEIIKKNKIKLILEIGTATGYSAMEMALVDELIKVITIEKDEERYLEAIKNVKKNNLEKRIKLILGDAKEIELKQKFDLIFIDAAKSSNLVFFEKFKNNLTKNGLIITDNINFSLAKKNNSKRVLRMLKKIELYRQFLIENKDFETTFIDLGDGLSISKKRC